MPPVKLRKTSRSSYATFKHAANSAEVSSLTLVQMLSRCFHCCKQSSPCHQHIVSIRFAPVFEQNVFLSAAANVAIQLEPSWERGRFTTSALMTRVYDKLYILERVALYCDAYRRQVCAQPPRTVVGARALHPRHLSRPRERPDDFAGVAIRRELVQRSDL